MARTMAKAEPQIRLQLRLFGYPSVSVNDEPLRLGDRRALALIVYLVWANGAVPRETVSTLLWPEADGDIGRMRLRRLVYKIRQAMGVDVIGSDRLNLHLAENATPASDVAAFEQFLAEHRFAEAEALYSSDFLQGFHVDEASELDEWMFFRREALRGRLVHALERLIQAEFEQERFPEAARFARRLVECDPLNEAAHRHLISAAMRGGDLVSARRHYQFCSEVLERTLGVSPAEETRALLAAPISAAPAALPISTVRYVGVDGLHVAYRTIGEGPVDILLVPGFVSHVERALEDRNCRRWIESVAKIGRVILFDRRGVGLSDRIDAHPTPEAVAGDMQAVLDALASRRAIVVAASEGGPGSLLFTARFPERVQHLILWGAMAKGCRSPDYPFALSAQQFDLWLGKFTREWGEALDLCTFAPSLADDAPTRRWWASLLRAASSPGSMRAVLSALRDVDVRPLLGQIAVPTTVMHRKGDQAVRMEAAVYMAERIPEARLVLVEGADHWFWAGDQEPLISEIEDAARRPA